MQTFAMMILGCKVNDYEATYLQNKLSQRFTEVPFKEKADCYIIFTCCVTNMAEAKTRKMFHRARSLNKDAYIVAVGCMSQIKGDAPDFEDVDLVVGSADKDKLYEMIVKGFKGNQVKDLKGAPFEVLEIDSYPGKSRAFVKIQDGCNQFCSYCIIPFARGRERSASHELLLKQCANLAKKTPEIVLTGIHTGRYADNGYYLKDLLHDLLKIEELQTIRLSSIEISEINDEIIELMASTDRIGRNLHIPVQALSDTILKAMHRPYTMEEYCERIAYIRKRIPDISISTDLIVGFPGESDELFESSLEMLERIHFSFIHVFPYAAKKGTLADRMPDKVADIKKKQRVLKIIELQKPYKLAYEATFINKKIKVLVEKSQDGFSFGYSKQYFYVQLDRELPIGQLVEAIVTQVDDEGVRAHYVAE